MSKKYTFVPPAKFCVFPALWYMGTKLMAAYTLLSLYKYEEDDDDQIFAIELENINET